VRLDVAIASRGLARSRNQASELIANGQVLVNGKPAQKPSMPVSESDQVEITGESYVARSAGKLAGALTAFGISNFKTCIDAGSSTGGFTQVLLERGAQKVYAIDVGTEQLADELASDPRVVSLEGQDIRQFKPEQHDLDVSDIDLLVADLSFISLRLVVGSFAKLAPRGDLVVLIKPQFELSKRELTSQGLVKSKDSKELAVKAVLSSFEETGFGLLGLIPSEVRGSGGNQEYLLHAKLGVQGRNIETLLARISF
jgi:23S rRNA (cytidine1920-2'-O)/16S rRNA (cytidine1409-2'-O)-methyltransferase